MLHYGSTYLQTKQNVIDNESNLIVVLHKMSVISGQFFKVSIVCKSIVNDIHPTKLSETL